MKKIFTIIVLAVMTLTVVAQQKKVAVYVTGEQSGVSKVLGDQLVTAFAKSGKYAAIERTSSFLAELSKEQNYQRTGAVNDNEIARLGVQFGVHYVCVADITEAFGEKYISARLIDVETAEVVNTHNVSGEMNSMSTCVQMASEIATNLSKGTFAEQAAEAKLREEAERKKAEEEERKAKLRAQGWVDLGLPSGTLWKSTNETGFYSYDNAVSTFGSHLPTMEQWKELQYSCKWTWSQSGYGYGYKVEGYNGEYIFLPATCGPNFRNIYNNDGMYWQSTRLRQDDSEKYIHFRSAYISTTCDCYRKNSLCVRLVK